MNEIKIFNNPQFGEIRTATSETGEPLFCLADLCSILEIANPSRVANELLDDDLRTAYPIVDKLGRTQNAIFINESGLYQVIFQSRKPEAKTFRKWVTSEVLPTIRKHGAYMSSEVIEKTLTDPDFIIRLATDLKEERRQKELAQKQLAVQAPIVKYANEVLSSTTGHTATTIAAELNMSAETLNEMLVTAKIIRRTGSKGEYSLTAQYQGKNIAITKTAKFEHSDGSKGTKMYLHFTEEGRKLAHQKFHKAKEAGFLIERKGRFFVNPAWKATKKEEEAA